MSEPGIAQRILTVIAGFRRKGTMESSLCWDAGELERLAMFAISAKNDLARGVVPPAHMSGCASEIGQPCNCRSTDGD